MATTVFIIIFAILNASVIFINTIDTVILVLAKKSSRFRNKIFTIHGLKKIPDEVSWLLYQVSLRSFHVLNRNDWIFHTCNILTAYLLFSDVKWLIFLAIFTLLENIILSFYIKCIAVKNIDDKFKDLNNNICFSETYHFLQVYYDFYNKYKYYKIYYPNTPFVCDIAYLVVYDDGRYHVKYLKDDKARIFYSRVLDYEQKCLSTQEEKKENDNDA